MIITPPSVLKIPDDIPVGAFCLYGQTGSALNVGNVMDEGIEIVSGDDVAHIEVYAGQTVSALTTPGGVGNPVSWASRNGIGVGLYGFRSDGLRYVYVPLGVLAAQQMAQPGAPLLDGWLKVAALNGLIPGFDADAVTDWFNRGIDGLPYGWNDITANLEPDARGLATTDLRKCGGADCSHFAAALEEVAGCTLFNPEYPKNKIKPNDFKKTAAAKCIWNYQTAGKI